MTPEALEQLAAQLAAQQASTASGSHSSGASSSRAAAEKHKKNEKPLMQLIVGDGDQQPQFRIGGQTFRADAVNEQSTCEIYARHHSPVSDSDQPGTVSTGASPFQMVAKVDGRLQMKRDFDSKIQQSVSERTARLNKEAQPRSAIILDAPVTSAGGLAKNSPRSHQTKQTPVSQVVMPPAAAASVLRPNDPKGVAAFTPPKSDGSPASATSSTSCLKHTVPDDFATLDLTIPTRWDRQIPTAIRLIHVVAAGIKTEADVLNEVGMTVEAEQKEARRALGILCVKTPEGKLRLRNEAYYYLRPWRWVHYPPANRANASKEMRKALRNLSYTDADEIWAHVSKDENWVDPWKNTPEGMAYHHEKQQLKAASEAAAKEQREKEKAEALANPAPMLTSNIRPGIYKSNPAPAKGKKAAKEKEPRTKKEKLSGSSEQDSATHPRNAPSANQSSSAASTSGSGAAVEPKVVDSELKIRQAGPGSAGGKLAVARRFQREKVEGRASTVSTPTRSPRPLPNTTPTQASEGRKRKADDEDYDQERSTKKKKAATQAPTGRSEASTVNSKKRKGDDIEALSPPAKARKADLPVHPHAGSSTSKGTTVRRKEKTSAASDFNRRLKTWDYSSDEGRTSVPSSSHKPDAVKSGGKNGASSSSQLGQVAARNARSRAFPTPHPVPPPTTQLGFKAVFLQKLAEYEMVRGILLAEEAKLANMRVGDDSSALMSVQELRHMMRRRENLEIELKEVKAEMTRLANKARSGG